MIADARKTRGIIRRDTRANQPAATDVLFGTIYYITDEGIIERSNGVAWETYSSTGAPFAQSDVTGLVADLASKLESPVDLITQVLGILPTANGGTSVNIASAALPLGSGQITFPAVQNPSSDANVLDDYEEGTWTVTDLSGAGLILTPTTPALYIKIGQLVNCGGDITFPVTADTSTVVLSFPFSGPGTLNWSGMSGYNTLTYDIMLHGSGSGWNIYPVATGGAALTNANMSGKRIMFIFSMRAVS